MPRAAPRAVKGCHVGRVHRMLRIRSSYSKKQSSSDQKHRAVARPMASAISHSHPYNLKGIFSDGVKHRPTHRHFLSVGCSPATREKVFVTTQGFERASGSVIVTSSVKVFGPVCRQRSTTRSLSL